MCSMMPNSRLPLARNGAPGSGRQEEPRQNTDVVFSHPFHVG